MTRSYKKVPIFGIAATSDKKDKQFANRRLRHKVKMGFWDLRLRDISSTWAFAKDGKRYWANAPKKALSK